MRSRIIKFCVIFLAMLAVAGCKKNFNISEKQAVLFQYEFINHAWGDQHYGFFIDNEGNVLTYNKPEGWNFPDNDFIISQDKLFENLSKCTISEKIIHAAELDKFTRHIANIASSKVSAVKNTGADMGSHRYTCYKFDEGWHVYKGYLIKMEGDNTCENLNYISKKIVSWMKEISDNVSLK